MKIKRLFQATVLTAVLTIMIVAPGGALASVAQPDGFAVIQGGWCRVC